MNQISRVPGFYLLLIGSAVLLGILAVWLILRARRPVRSGGVIAGVAVGKGGWLHQVRRLLDALAEAARYVAKRREWRYQVPWLLLMGEAGSGKTSLAASAGSPRREILSGDEEALALPGTRWWFFERGVLIDLERNAAPNGKDLEQRAAWGTVVHGLFDHRPERPIDGVVLTVSARVLLDGSSAELQRVAEANYAQLVELQRRFEFTFPIYVVVTQCDAVEGFDAFWGQQHADRLREMVGWSNPYSLDSGFVNEWVEEAFDRIGEGLKQLQLQAAGAAAASPDVDRFFLFPQRMRQLCAPLGTVLEGVFRPSGYHANFLFRGVYFTGAVGGEGGQLPKVRDDVAFTAALLDEKAFAEANLARVTSGGILSRHRVVRRLQMGIVAGFALLCTWLAFSSFDIRRQVDGTVLVLNAMKDPQFRNGGDGGCAGKESIYPLLELLSRVDLEFAHLSVPASWLDTRHAGDEAKYIADTALEEVILPGLRCRLEERARGLEKTALDLPDPTLDAPTAVARLREAVVGQAQELEAFEVNLAIYRGLAMPGSPGLRGDILANFESLALYLYGAPLPASVVNRSGVLRAALINAQDDTPVALPENMRAHATERVLRQAEEARKELHRRLAQGAEYMAALDAEQPPYLSNVNGLIAWMRWVQTDWLGASDASDPCRRLEATLRPILNRLSTEFEYAAPLARATDSFSQETCFAPALRQLEELNAPPHGVLFVKGERGLAMVPSLKAELARLDTLAAAHFMQQPPGDGFICRNPLRRWDVDRIAGAAQGLREFEQWLGGAGEAAGRERGWSIAERVARRQIESVTADLLVAAQIPLGFGDDGSGALAPLGALDEQVRQQSVDFGRAVDPLVLVIQVLRQRGFESTATRVSQCVRDAASDALYSVDTLAAASRLYAPSFAADNGNPDLLLAGLPTDAETKDYLKRQLQRGKVLGGYAAPFVSFLMNTDGVDDSRQANREAAVFWGNTIAEVNRYVQFKEPNGQVAYLDDYFLKQVAPLTSGNCAAQLASYKPPAYGNDLFSAQRAALEKRVTARCTTGREAVASSGYQALAREFNQTLAGRFPFGGDARREAPVMAAKRFLLGYAAQREQLRTEIKALKGARWRDVDQFLDKLDAAARFFGTNLAAGETSQPVQLKLGFRAHPEASTGTEQLVSWRFRSGSDVAVFPNGTRELEWQYGRPVALDLVWADQSQQAPAADAAQDHLKVDHLTATFSAEGPWSLLKLMSLNAPRQPPRQESLDPTVRLLEFEVPVLDRQSGKGQHTRMYLSLQMLGLDPQSGKPAPLRVPDLFPDYAPRAW